MSSYVRGCRMSLLVLLVACHKVIICSDSICLLVGLSFDHSGSGCGIPQASDWALDGPYMESSEEGCGQ